jgi:hypothetical protein
MFSLEEDLGEIEEAAETMIRGMGYQGALLHTQTYSPKDEGEEIVTMLLRVAITRRMREALRN